MTSNLHEFMAMVGIVCSATFFILMFRWGIYKLGSIDDELQQEITSQVESTSLS